MTSQISRTLAPIVMLLAACFSAHAQEPEFQYVQAGSHKLAYLCKGQGELTVLLVSGMGLDAYATFRNTFNKAEPGNYRLCMYDRAGTGRSAYDKPGARPMRELVEELESFVAATGMADLILAPHSFGGMLARAYTHRNPDRVRGMVLIDAAHESWYGDLQASMSEEAWEIMSWIIDWERDVHAFEDFEEAASYTGYSTRRDLPVIVMSRGIPHVGVRQTGMSYADVDAYTITWNRSQVAQRMISDDVEWVTMRYASHLFDETDPWIVIKHLEEMVTRVSAPPGKTN